MRAEIVGVAVTLAAMVFAQTSPVPISSSWSVLSQLISALGPMGFVMWLVWRTTNHTIPRLAQDFEAAMDRERTDFKEALTQQREDFMTALEREREVFAEMVESIKQARNDEVP